MELLGTSAPPADMAEGAAAADLDSVVYTWGSLDGMIAAFACMFVFYSMRNTLRRMLAPAPAGGMKES